MRNDKPWLEGIKAFEADQPRESNPYSAGETTTNEAVDWFEGFDLASVVFRKEPA